VSAFVRCSWVGLSYSRFVAAITQALPVISLGFPGPFHYRTLRANPTAGDAAAYLLNSTHLFVASRTASTALCSGLSRTSALPVSSELSRP
jgi:hypothetical protein